MHPDGGVSAQFPNRQASIFKVKIWLAGTPLRLPVKFADAVSVLLRTPPLQKRPTGPAEEKRARPRKRPATKRRLCGLTSPHYSRAVGERQRWLWSGRSQRRLRHIGRCANVKSPSPMRLTAEDELTDLAADGRRVTPSLAVNAAQPMAVRGVLTSRRLTAWG